MSTKYVKLVLDKGLFNLSWEYILLFSILLYFILTQTKQYSFSKTTASLKNLKVTYRRETINVLFDKFNKNLNFDKYAYV